ncbi:MAG: PQQ-like beta-propeller repeat protein [Pirellulales bacterium]|nr:PQQ-like beta-propeller repeat protein [Pirellulales bacterium]
MRFTYTVAGFFLLILVPFISPAAAADWPQFRGPRGQGHSDATELPLKWSETENITWKVPVEGRGWSSPVIRGNEIWMTTALATIAKPEVARQKLDSLGFAVPSPEVAERIVLKAVEFDRESGRLIRSVTLLKIDKLLQICEVNSYASPTPVIEAGRLYCDFGTMGTVCLDTATGKTLWERHLPVEHQVGPGSSPILYGKLLVLVRDGCDVQYIAALDKQTGDIVWKTPRPPIKGTYTPYKKAFSTPLVIDHGGRRQMVSMGAQWIVSYDPDTGKELWRVDTGQSFSNTARPVFGNGLVFVSTAFGGSELFAIRPDGRGDVTDTHISWTARKQVPQMPSPLLVENLLYTVSDGGVAMCTDAVTGKVHWTKRLSGKYYASPIFGAGRIYFFSEDGEATVIRPGNKFVELTKNKLDGRFMASAAVSGRALFLRNDTHLYRIEQKNDTSRKEDGKKLDVLLGKPAVVAVGRPEDKMWGLYQFPSLFRLADGVLLGNE